MVAFLAKGPLVAFSPLFDVDGSTTSVEIDAGARDVVQISTLEGATLALAGDGRVWSWGMNPHGQLGRPGHLSDPQPLAVGLPARIVRIAAGSSHALALDSEGAVWTWGANAAGQLGTGSLEPSHRPLRVELPARIRSIGAGDTHSLAVDDRGRCWGWGSNQFGQLAQAVSAGSARGYHARPVRLALGFPVAHVDAGMHYSVALTTAGEVHAWGWNGLGQLGVEGGAASAKPVRIGGLSGIRQVSAGPGHVLAADDAARLYAWGDNRSAACGCAATQSVVAQPVHIEFA